MFSAEITALARHVIDAAADRGITIVTAESCTGGLVAGALTTIPGSSSAVEGGFITYANSAKQLILGVPADTLARVGAVSRETALAMADGALKHSTAGIAVATTGIAGPGGGTPTKPVGLVHIAVLVRKGNLFFHDAPIFPGDRDAVRAQTVERALEMILKALTA